MMRSVSGSVATVAEQRAELESSEGAERRGIPEGPLSTTNLTEGRSGGREYDDTRAEEQDTCIHLASVSGCCLPLRSQTNEDRAMAKLGHPDGEINLTKGAANTGIVQIVSNPICRAWCRWPADSCRSHPTPPAPSKRCQPRAHPPNPSSSSFTSIETVPSPQTSSRRSTT